MRAIRWLWDIGIPVMVALACFIAAFVSILFTDDPNHVWLAYFFGVTWFTDAALDGYRDRETRKASKAVRR